MKANAPKKIYLYPSDRAGEEYEDEWGDIPWGEDYVEYTRTDVFFKKLEEWLDEYISDMVEVDTRILVGSFKNYIEGKL